MAGATHLKEHPMPLTGQVALVTGAGRGIGRAVALALAQAGADVAVNDLETSKETDEVAAAVRGMDRQAVVVRGDVSKLEAVEEMAAAAVSAFGRLDLAVANA